jgi:dTDP-L-rhamnose 4-epimerase
VHVDDVAHANVLALERWHCASHGGHRGAQIALNVASGTPVTVLEVADSLCRGAHTRLRPVVVGGARAGDVRHVFASTERARIELGFVSATEPTRGIEGFATAPLRAAVA